jgi:hypothetical protein
MENDSKNLVKLGKKVENDNSIGKRGRPPKSSSPEVKQAPPLSEKEQRDQNAKEVVDKLLENIPLSLTKDNESKETPSEPSNVDIKSSDWLQEQVVILTKQNEEYKLEAERAKSDYSKLLVDYQALKVSKEAGIVYEGDGNKKDPIKNNVITVFNELQQNDKLLGKNFVIVPRAFMMRLIMYFPFLNEHKTF